MCDEKDYGVLEKHVHEACHFMSKGNEHFPREDGLK